MMWVAQTRVGSSREEVLKAWRPARVPPKPKPTRDMKTRAVNGAVLDLKRASGRLGSRRTALRSVAHECHRVGGAPDQKILDWFDLHRAAVICSESAPNFTCCISSKADGEDVRGRCEDQYAS